MKKVKILLASALVLASVCSLATINTYADSKTSNLNTDSIPAVNVPSNVIALHSENPKEIFWQCTNIKNKAIAKIKQTVIVPGSYTGETGGTTRFLIEGLAPGTTEMTFSYYDSTKKAVLKVVTYVVTVDSDLKVTTKEKEESKYGKIVLEGNPSTGYEWQYTIKDEKIAEIKREITPITDIGEPEPNGRSEMQTWSVKGLKPGTTEVKYEYLRPWGEEKADKVVTYIIKVDRDLNVTVNKKPDIEEGTTVISLTSNPSTGYEWEYELEDPSIVQVGKRKIEYDSEKIQPGQAGRAVWPIKGLKAGTTEMTFNYLRPWEEDSNPTETRVYVIDVDEELNVKVSGNYTEDPQNKSGIKVTVEENDEKVSNQISPIITLKNTTDKEIDLSKVVLKYYYTEEGNGKDVFQCYYAGMMGEFYENLTDYIVGNIKEIPVDKKKDNADRCIEISFDRGVLSKEGTVQINASIHKENWESVYDRTNDYSYKKENGVKVYIEK